MKNSFVRNIRHLDRTKLAHVGHEELLFQSMKQTIGRQGKRKTQTDKRHEINMGETYWQPGGACQQQNGNFFFLVVLH